MYDTPEINIIKCYKSVLSKIRKSLDVIIYDCVKKRLSEMCNIFSYCSVYQKTAFIFWKQLGFQIILSSFTSFFH